MPKVVLMPKRSVALAAIRGSPASSALAAVTGSPRLATALPIPSRTEAGVQVM